MELVVEFAKEQNEQYEYGGKVNSECYFFDPCKIGKVSNIFIYMDRSRLNIYKLTGENLSNTTAKDSFHNAGVDS